MYHISNIIKILSNKEAFLLYTSDHGEELGESGVYGHGQRKNDNQNIKFC